MKSAQGVARARMLLKKHMGWLPGYPGESTEQQVKWYILKAAPNDVASIVVDRSHLKRMQDTVTKLRHRFPRALPKVVESVSDWLERMDLVLATLKKAIHDERPLDMEPWLESARCTERVRHAVRAVKHERPELTKLVEAAFCIEFTGLRLVKADGFRWILKHADTLESLSTLDTQTSAPGSLVVQMQLYNLRDEVSAANLSAFSRGIANVQMWSLSIPDAQERVKTLEAQARKLIDGHEIQPLAKSNSKCLAAAFCDLLDGVSLLRPKQRTAVLGFCESILLQDFFEQLDEITERITADEKKLGRFVNRLLNDQSKRPTKRSERRDLRAEIQIARLQSGPVRQLVFAMQRIVHPSMDPRHLTDWTDFLGSLPERSALRLGLFDRWEGQFVHDSETSFRRSRAGPFPYVLKRIGRLLRRRGCNQSLLLHWDELAQEPRGYRSDFIMEMVDEVVSHSTYDRAFELLEATLYDSNSNVEVDADLLAGFVEIAEATSDMPTAMRVARLLRDEEYRNFLVVDDLKIALNLESGKASVVEILSALFEDYELSASLSGLRQKQLDDSLKRAAGRLIVQGQKKSVTRLSSSLQVLESIGLTPSQLEDKSDSSDWISRYPSMLHDDLLQLCRVVGNEAAAIASKLLGAQFPSEDDLRRELRVLNEKHTAAGDGALRERISKRISNLKSRIEQPVPVSEQRMQHLVAKLQRRVDDELVTRTISACNDIAAETLQGEFRIDSLPDDLFKVPNDQLIASVMGLKGSLKRLGLQLLTQTEPLQHFRQQQANLDFCQAIESRGIKTQPWLDPPFSVCGMTRNGEKYQVRFTNDVTDYLLMGSHFGTCLSPGAFNFFSTISNAVDVNKQVVFGKTDGGRIIGRCLFTLADDGCIMLYHRYFHDPGDGFNAAVEEFAARLALEMGTKISATGRVSTLVASEWHDDGTVIPGMLNAAQYDSPIREVLRTATPQNVLASLTSILGEAVDLSSILGQLLVLDEFDKRPEIIEPFVECFGLDRTVPLVTRLRIAVIASRNNMKDAALEIVASLRPQTLIRQLKRLEAFRWGAFYEIGSCSHAEVYDLFIALSPSLALRLIRGSRPKGVSHDLEETDRERRRTLARIHRALGRAELADRLKARLDADTDAAGG